MIQELIIPSLGTLLAGSALFSVFYFRRSSDLNKQVQTLTADSAPEATEKLAEVTAQLEQFRSRMEELEKSKQASPDTSAASVSAPAQANRRGQVMRLYRSGESVSSIASALGVSQGEVKLMVKVQELLSAQAGGERTPDFL